MSLRARFASSVSAGIRLRGEEYFGQERVRLHVCGPTEANATVTGGTDYRVHLTREADTLRASCTCPFYDRGLPCKHIWAVLLAVDARRGLLGPNGALPRRLLTVDPNDKRGGGGLARRGPAPNGRPGSEPGAPTWRDLLNQVQTARPEAKPAAGELLYAIDVPASQKSQRLTLDILAPPRKRDGSEGKLKQLRITRQETGLLPDPDDRKILSLLAGATSGGLMSHWYSPLGSYPAPTHCELPAASAEVLLPMLCATGRCRLMLAPETFSPFPLTWAGGQAWELWLEVREGADGACRIDGGLRRGDERMDLSRPLLLVESGFVFTEREAARVDTSGTYSWISLLRRHGSLRVPAAERGELLERLLNTAELPHLDLPDSLRVQETYAAPRPRLRLVAPNRRYQHQQPGWPSAELSFLYDGREVRAGSPGRGVYEPATRRLLLRDAVAEQRSAARLRELGLRPSPDPLSGAHSLAIPAPRVPKVVRVLLAEGWSVEAEGKLYRAPGRFQMGLSSGVDWFELHGEAEFEGVTLNLPDLLAALRRDDGFVELGDGTLGILPEEWLRRIAPIAGLGAKEGDHLRFTPAQTALLDAWLEAEPEVSFDAKVEQARRHLRDSGGVVPAYEPPGFRGELRGYQRIGLGWLHSLREVGFGGCLADDMGLGKTVQVLALLETRRVLRQREGLPPSLLVVPKSLVFNWIQEAARFTPQLAVLDYTGAARAKSGDPFAGHDLVLITYGTLRRDILRLRQTEFDYLILDEAQAIKNAESQTAQSARLLRGKHRLALTGTPVENHLGELWSLLEFLNPGLLGSSPLLRGGADDLRNPEPAAREVYARAVRPFLLRRTKEAVAPELPPKIEQTLFCELPPKQRRLYDELRDHYRSSLDARIGTQGLGKSKILVLEALLRLRQAACHPGLLDADRADEPCAKLDLLLPQLEEVLEEGHKALVFSQFTRFLALLRSQLDKAKVPYVYLDGQTRNRQERVEQFQNDPDCKLFLISLKAGGLGLNLTAADYVYLLDPWWNPAVEAQAIDRTHRIGQTRPVFASRLVARGTVEEKILELQRSKRALADAVIHADQSLVSGLTREDLDLLLS